MNFMKQYDQDFNKSTKKLLNITQYQPKERVKHSKKIKIMEVINDLKLCMSQLPSAESILSTQDRIKILKIRRIFVAAGAYYEHQNLYIFDNIVEKTVNKEKYIKSKEEGLPRKFNGNREITYPISKKPKSTITLEALKIPDTDEIFEKLEDIQLVQLEQDLSSSISSASTVTIEHVALGHTNGGLDVTGQLFVRDWSFSSPQESALDLFEERDVNVEAVSLIGRQEVFTPNRLSQIGSPLILHDDTNELEQHFATFTENRTAPGITVKPPKVIKETYRAKTKVITLENRRLSFRYLQSRFPEDEDEDLSLLHTDLPPLDFSSISSPNISTGELDESPLFQQNLLVEINESVGRVDELRLAVPSQFHRPTELPPTELSRIQQETAEPSFQIQDEQILGHPEVLPDPHISRVSELPSTLIHSRNIEEDEISPQDFYLKIKEKISSTWNEKNSSTIKFTDICSLDTNRLEAAKTFFVLLDLYKKQEISLSQDSSNPDQIFINKK